MSTSPPDDSQRATFGVRASTPPPFIGKDAELRQLSRTLEAAMQGRGSIVFLEGRRGTGKSALLKELQGRITQHPTLMGTFFVSGYCDEISGPTNTFGPFVEILQSLSAINDRPDIKKILITLAKETGPEWLNIIPGIGPAVTAGIKTATTAASLLFPEEKARQTQSLPFQYIDILTNFARKHPPLVLVIHDAQWMDESSRSILRNWARTITESPVVIIVCYRPEEPLYQATIRKDQHSIVGDHGAETIILHPWTAESIQLYLVHRYNSRLHDRFHLWLRDLCDGNPLFVEQYLSLLEQEEVITFHGDRYVLHGEFTRIADRWQVGGRLASLELPDRIEHVIQRRIEQLIRQDRELLELAAVQGEQFFSIILARVLGLDHKEVAARLHDFSRQHRIIVSSKSHSWAWKISDVYSFEHLMMRQVLYNELSPFERRTYHARVAEMLQQIEQELPGASRNLRVEIAYHCDLSGEHLSAARHYFQAAQALFLDGAMSESVSVCQEARRCVGVLTQKGQDVHRLHAEIIQLMLSAVEARWTYCGEDDAGLPVLELLREAWSEAGRVGDRKLLAQLKFLEGRLLIGLQGLDAGIAAMEEALAAAQSVGDHLLEFAILVRLGHDKNGQDMTQGIALLHRAARLYDTHLQASAAADDRAVVRHAMRLRSFIGVGEFDLGNFSVAERWLRESVIGLRDMNAMTELCQALNYMAQLYTAMGRFEEAESALKESLDLTNPHDAEDIWTAYNRALLGKTYLEWGRIEDAVEPLSAGFHTSEKLTYVAIRPLVRAYYAELLMDERYGARDLRAADDLLEKTVAEAEATGYRRSVIGALSLRAKVALIDGRLDDALRYSGEATERLDAIREAPALRREEVWFNRYGALGAAGQIAEAAAYLQRAREELERKARSVDDDAIRRTFLERVPISRAISAAMNPSPA